MQHAIIRSRISRIVMVASLSLYVPLASAAPKTDIVIFKNGDKLTGEVKSLIRGQLELNTEATGTIGIEWDKVASIVSKQRIQVEVSSGTRYFGDLASLETDSAGIVVITDDGPQALETEQVVAMTPIEGFGIRALDVEMSVGYDYAKAGGPKACDAGFEYELPKFDSNRVPGV